MNAGRNRRMTICEKPGNAGEEDRDEEPYSEFGFVDGFVAAGEEEGEAVRGEGREDVGEDSADGGCRVNVSKLGGVEVVRWAREDLGEDDGDTNTLQRKLLAHV